MYDSVPVKNKEEIFVVTTSQLNTLNFGVGWFITRYMALQKELFSCNFSVPNLGQAFKNSWFQIEHHAREVINVINAHLAHIGRFCAGKK